MFYMHIFSDIVLFHSHSVFDKTLSFAMSYYLHVQKMKNIFYEIVFMLIHLRLKTDEPYSVDLFISYFLFCICILAVCVLHTCMHFQLSLEKIVFSEVMNHVSVALVIYAQCDNENKLNERTKKLTQKSKLKRRKKYKVKSIENNIMNDMVSECVV